jgi:hypothetical protein
MNAPTLTHYLVVAYTILSGFAASPQGLQLIHQYPYLAGVASTLAFLGALYHVPSGAIPNDQK